MCGLAGELQFDAPEGRAPAVIDRLSALMARRGPDDAGFWRDGDRAWLAFRRLAILDLSPAGHQPMLTADGRFALIFNGEVYNFRELRQELEQGGVRFGSTGDAEVVLQALAHWGAAALDRFNGMFALGFYDCRDKTLLLARDHAGIKPLYYLLNRRGLFFASQYDQILAHPWRRDLPVSPEGLSLYLRLGYIPAPYAILQQTYMLEPGSWLSVSADGRVRRGVFFTFPSEAKPDLVGPAADEAVDAAVTAAVRRQMISDVPLGTFLSGGIDSPLVAAKAQSAGSGRIKAFTIGSAGSRYDESEDAVAYAQALGVAHVLEQFTPDRVLAHLDDVVAACGEPFADYSVFPTLLVSQLARREVTVMLSGDGGDELFWGYAGRFGSVLSAADDFRRPYWWRSARWGLKRGLALGNGHQNLRWQTIGDWYRGKHSRLPDSMLQAIFSDAPGWPADYKLFDYDGHEAGRTAQWLRWNEFVGHLTMVLLKVDRASMYHSLEVRVPLLDREVIAAALRVDWRSCLDLNTGQGKMPLRRALAGHVAHQTQTKRGFAVPMDEWLRGPLREVFADVVLGRRELLGMTLNRSALEAILARHRNGESDYGYALWTLLSLALWHDRHFAPVSSKEPIRSSSYEYALA